MYGTSLSPGMLHAIVVDNPSEESHAVDNMGSVSNGTVLEQEAPGQSRLYFVRMPRPVVDDALLKHLQQEFQARIAEMRSISSIMAAKREMMHVLRNRMYEARSLKGASQPEYDQKVRRLKQLREVRNGHLSRVACIRDSVRTLDCRSEQELDARIRQQEDRIRLGSLTLRDEKSAVQEIGRLRSQRDRIRAYEQQRGLVAELEAAAARVKAEMDGLEAEFSMVKGERDSVSRVMSDLYMQLKAEEKAAEAAEGEHRAAVERKNQALAALESARREMDSSMQDYRENRKFSLHVRDMVAIGQTFQAQGLCAEQVEVVMSRLMSDPTFWAEYCQMWAGRRQYPVSDLLPESSTSATSQQQQQQQVPHDGGRGQGRGIGPARSVVPVVPELKLVPRGAERAKDLIASIMLEANAEAALAKGSGAMAAEGSDCADEAAARSGLAAPAARLRAAMESAESMQHPAAKNTELPRGQVETPVANEVEFEVPVQRHSGSELVSKSQLQEEQRLKAEQAEGRKRRARQAKERKRAKAADLQREAAAGEPEATLVAQQQQGKVLVEPAEPEPKPGSPEVQSRAANDAAVIRNKSSASRYMGGKAPSSTGKGPARVAPSSNPLAAPARRPFPAHVGMSRKLRRLYLANQTAFFVALVVLLMALVIIAGSFY